MSYPGQDKKSVTADETNLFYPSAGWCPTYLDIPHLLRCLKVKGDLRVWSSISLL